MKCPVCGKKSQYRLCPECGFDSSRDYERYPTLAPIGEAPAVSALKKEWQVRKPDEVLRRKRPWLALIACAVVLVLGIGIGAGLGREKPVPTEPQESVQIQVPTETEEPTLQNPYEPVEEPWRENVLRSDVVPSFNFTYTTASYVVEYPVFGSEYLREQISSVTFLDTLSGVPENAWDVSEAGDGSVMAWVIPNGDLYDLYIGAEGGVNAGESCQDLFAGYFNAQQIHNMEFFHTEDAQNMRGMFIWCESLTSLDLSSFDTANVQDMSNMFYGCGSLTSLDLSCFDTSKVQNMSSMFNCCESLRDLDLSSFDTANVQDMSKMFSLCESLTSLDLSRFNTTKVQDMSRMFFYCESLTSLDLRNFDTSNVRDTGDMFNNCPAGSDWQHLLKD